MDLDRLADLHVGQLCLFEIGRHPNVGIDQGEQRLAGLQIVAQFDGAMGDAAGDRRDDFGVREIQFGPLRFRLALCWTSASAVDLLRPGQAGLRLAALARARVADLLGGGRPGRRRPKHRAFVG